MNKVKKVRGKVSLLSQAEMLINGDRARDYGDIESNFKRIALTWSCVLDTEVTPKQVALCMVGLKLARESHKHKDDNLIDGMAYFDIAGGLS